MTNKATYDEWYTPQETLEAIGIRFDLDPASPGPETVPWTARQHFTKEANGLLQPWEGKVFLNPPYSAPLPWAERMVGHRDGGVCLVRSSTETRYFQMLAGSASAMLLKKGRIRFVRQNGVQSEVLAPFPSVFFAFGQECADALLNSSIPGIRVRLNQG